jgi:hypothetical protein
MRRALVDGLRRAVKPLGLPLLLLATNIAFAAILAVPFEGLLETSFHETASATTMVRGFDFAWWSHWSDGQSGWAKAFGPAILGSGFAFKNVEALVGGELPARLFVHETEGTPRARPHRGEGLDVLVLTLGLLYLVFQTFLAGGVLGVLRGSGSFTLRGLLHGSGFYFGRMVRIALVALLAHAALFGLNAPLARWADRQALEAASETIALAWSFGQKGLLLLGILFIHMLSCYAKVVTVMEERQSALLAFLSSIGFCLGHLRQTFGHYLAVAFLGVMLLLAWSLADGHWAVTGFRTQLVALLLAQALVFGRIVLRVGLFGGQVSLYRRLTAR